jgi:excisionase family DNA binding protein
MKLFNAYQLANKLGITHTTVYTWVDKGLPFERITIGKRISMRFDLDKVKEWLQNNPQIKSK